jgi:hypothetical protein
MAGTGIIVGEVSFNTNTISWKNMMYLWKHFLEARRLPNVIVSTKLRQELTSILGAYYREEDEMFFGINSKYLPSVCKFIQFWDDKMEHDETEIELEISDILALFKKWCESRNEHIFNMNEKQVVDLITYFYPDVEIDQDKYVYKWRCTMWNKQMDIMMAIDDLKAKYGIMSDSSLRISKSNSSLSLCSQDSNSNFLMSMNISIHDAYAHYCDFITKIEMEKHLLRPMPLLVSKQYFEKFIS